MQKNKLGTSLADRIKAAKDELGSIPKKDAPVEPLPNVSSNINNQLTKSKNIELSKKEERHISTAEKNIKNDESCDVESMLFVSGRLDRKKNEYTTKSFYLLKNMDSEIKAYCKGTDITVYNYLLYLGLEQIKKSESMMHVDVKLIEDTYC